MSEPELISPVTTRNPEFVITSAPLNNVPVELDGKPASPDKVAESQGAPHAQLSAEELKRKEELHTARKGDPAVLVDIPQTPGAEELARAGAGILDEAGSQVGSASS